MRILFLSHTYWGSPYRIGSHHLSSQMAADGHDVFYISTPVSLLHRLKYAADDARMMRAGLITSIRPGLRQWIPQTLSPAGIAFFRGWDFCELGLGGQLRKANAAIGCEPFDVVFIDEPRLAGFLRIFPSRIVVYRPTDIYASMGIRNWRALESHILSNADALICTSAPLLDFLSREFNFKGLARIQVNGVDYEHFLPATDVPLEYKAELRRKCLYVGALDFRFDADAFEQMARANPDVVFFVIGGGDSAIQAQITALENVSFLGFRPYSDIPSYMQHADMAVLPVRPGPSNDGRSPMKIYEYLACGLPVLAYGAAELRRRQLPGLLFYAGQSDIEAAFSQLRKAERFAFVDRSLHWHNIARVLLDSLPGGAMK
ncbi:MAG: glycosyltransferase [Moraxellaceae bacterium]